MVLENEFLFVYKDPIGPHRPNRDRPKEKKEIGVMIDCRAKTFNVGLYSVRYKVSLG